MEDITGGIQSGINSVITAGENALSEISSSPLVVAGAGALVGAGLTAGVTSLIKRKKKKKRSKKRKKSSKKKKYGKKLKFGSKAYRKKYLGKHYHHRRGKQTKLKKYHKKSGKIGYSHKQIHYTKNNQPYIILANGRARFIKKSSVGRARKLKGGMY